MCARAAASAGCLLLNKKSRKWPSQLCLWFCSLSWAFSMMKKMALSVLLNEDNFSEDDADEMRQEIAEL